MAQPPIILCSSCRCEIRVTDILTAIATSQTSASTVTLSNARPQESPQPFASSSAPSSVYASPMSSAPSPYPVHVSSTLPAQRAGPELYDRYHHAMRADTHPALHAPRPIAPMLTNLMRASPQLGWTEPSSLASPLHLSSRHPPAEEARPAAPPAFREQPSFGRSLTAPALLSTNSRRSLSPRPPNLVLPRSHDTYPSEGSRQTDGTAVMSPASNPQPSRRPENGHLHVPRPASPPRQPYPPPAPSPLSAGSSSGDSPWSPRHGAPLTPDTPYSAASSSLTSPVSQIGPVRTSDKKGKRKDKESTIPRPPNAWILYRSDQLKGLVESGNPNKIAQADMSRLIGYMWRDEKKEVRAKYETMAQIAKLKHSLKYPDYRYQPQTSKQSKKSKSDAASSKNSEDTITNSIEAAPESSTAATEPVPVQQGSPQPSVVVREEDDIMAMLTAALSSSEPSAIGSLSQYA